jgi:hypothetical protein
MRYQRNIRELIQSNFQRYVSDSIDSESSWILDSSINPLVQGRDVIFDLAPSPGADRVVLVTALSMAEKGGGPVRTLLLTADQERLKVLKSVSRGIERDGELLYFLDEDEIQSEFRKLKNPPTLIAATAGRVIDHLRRDNLDLSGVRQLIMDMITPGIDLTGFFKDIDFVFTRLPAQVQKVVFSSGSSGREPLERKMIRPAVIMKKNERFDVKDQSQKELKPMSDLLNDNVRSFVDTMIKQVREKEDHAQLNDYRKLWKKTVPLMMRPWMAAWLFKECLSRQMPAQAPVMSGGMTLFVGVGRQRKVFPKDLVKLFIDKGKLNRDEIGEIKILESYSFVTVKGEKAADMIKKMDGMMYRGRKLNVNFAKKKGS